MARKKVYDPPPAHLSVRAQKIWNGVVRRCSSTERQVMLQTALEALDRGDEAAALIRQDGIVSKTPSTGATHVHPAVKIERDSRAQFARLWSELGLTGKAKLSTLGSFLEDE